MATLVVFHHSLSHLFSWHHWTLVFCPFLKCLCLFSLFQFLSQPLSLAHQIVLLPHVGAIYLSALSCLLSFKYSVSGGTVDWFVATPIYSLSFDCQIWLPLENYLSCFMHHLIGSGLQGVFTSSSQEMAIWPNSMDPFPGPWILKGVGKVVGIDSS